MAIDLLQEEALENVEANEEVIDADDAQYESAEGSQMRDSLQGNFGNMWAASWQQSRRVGVENGVVVHGGRLETRDFTGEVVAREEKKRERLLGRAEGVHEWGEGKKGKEMEQES